MAVKPGQIRIIGGLLKRTPIAVASDIAGMRPTPDRVRETLFNWIGPRVSGARCLDLFAGSGALGLEAASRGAASVQLNELNGKAAKLLAERLVGLAGAVDPAVQALAGTLELTRLDALAALRNAHRRGQRFDLVFLDPPFAESWLDRLIPALEPVLTVGAMIYLETGHEVAELPAVDDNGLPSTLSVERVRHGQAGQVHYHLFERIMPLAGN